MNDCINGKVILVYQKMLLKANHSPSNESVIIIAFLEKLLKSWNVHMVFKDLHSVVQNTSIYSEAQTWKHIEVT